MEQKKASFERTLNQATVKFYPVYCFDDAELMHIKWKPVEILTRDFMQI